MSEGDGNQWEKTESVFPLRENWNFPTAMFVALVNSRFVTTRITLGRQVFKEMHGD